MERALRMPSTVRATASANTIEIATVMYAKKVTLSARAADRTGRSAAWHRPPTVSEAPGFKANPYNGPIGTQCVRRGRHQCAKPLNHTVERSIYL